MSYNPLSENLFIGGAIAFTDPKPPIRKIALIGSSRFFKTYYEVASKLEVAGFLPLVTMEQYTGREKDLLLDEEIRKIVDATHMRILESDCVLIVNTSNLDTDYDYVGYDTLKDLYFCATLKKPVFLLSKMVNIDHFIGDIIKLNKSAPAVRTPFNK